MKRFGASTEQLAEIAVHLDDRRAADVCHVWPENWHALLVFLAMGSQWRVSAGLSVFRTGLDYTALPIVEARTPPTAGAPVPDAVTLFRQILCLERAALDVLNRSLQ